MEQNFHSKFDEYSEIVYRSNFSYYRYKFFLIIEKIYRIFINNEDSRLEIIVKNIKSIKPIFILEIGSGTLPIFLFLPEDIKKRCEYHICEVNQKKADFLKKKYKNYDNIVISCSDALSLPYQDGFFDMVFSKGVLHHIDADEIDERKKKRLLFLLESRRVLKNGGINLVMDFFYDRKNKGAVFWHYLHKIILAEGEHNFESRKEVENLFSLAGHREIKTDEFKTFKGLYYYIKGEK